MKDVLRNLETLGFQEGKDGSVIAIKRREWWMLLVKGAFTLVVKPVRTSGRKGNPLVIVPSISFPVCVIAKRVNTMGAQRSRDATFPGRLLVDFVQLTNLKVW